MEEIKLTVEGMSCSHCRRAVEEALKGIDGVEKVQVDLEKRKLWSPAPPHVKTGWSH